MSKLPFLESLTRKKKKGKGREREGSHETGFVASIFFLSLSRFLCPRLKEKGIK